MLYANTYNGYCDGAIQERRGEFMYMKFITTERVTLALRKCAGLKWSLISRSSARVSFFVTKAMLDEYSLIGYRRMTGALDVRSMPRRLIAHTIAPWTSYNVAKVGGELKGIDPRQQFKIPTWPRSQRIIAAKASARSASSAGQVLCGEHLPRESCFRKQAKAERNEGMGPGGKCPGASMAVLKLNSVAAARRFTARGGER